MTWIGKANELRLEPRILIEDPEKSYGTSITIEMLKTVEAAEHIMFNMGFKQVRVRVRHHGLVARIEIAVADFLRFLEDDIRRKVVERFKQLGFKHIALDLGGCFRKHE